MKNFFNASPGSSSVLYTYKDYIIANVLEFRISLMQEDPEWLYPTLYFRENRNKSIGKVCREWKEGKHIFLFQMVGEKLGPHDQAVYIPPIIVNSEFIRSQHPFKFTEDDYTGMVTDIIVVTKVKTYPNKGEKHPLIEEFEKRLIEKIQTLPQ